MSLPAGPVIVVCGLALAAGCVLKPKSSSEGRELVQEACAAYEGALADLRQGSIGPQDAGRRIGQAANTATTASARNSRWRKLAGDMRFASQQVSELDPDRLRNEPLYLPNGPAAQVLDTVNEECAGSRTS